MAVFAFLLVTTGINLRGQLCEPLVSISTTTSNICQGSTAVFNATALNAGSTPSYQWKVNGINTGTNSNIFVSSTLNNNDIVVVELTPDPSTCPEGPVVTSAAITVTVNLLPAVIITPSDPTTFCQGGSVTLASSAGTSYLWSTGEAIQSITITATGSYSVTVTDANGCSATSAPTVVTVNPLPIATITPAGPTTFCQGGSVILTSSPANSYLWNSGETTQSITVAATGSYSVTVTDVNGCSAASTSTDVTVNTLPIATITPAGPTTFCQGGSVTLTSSAGISYLWSTGETSQSITVTVTGSYSVSVTDVNGCSAASAPTPVTMHLLPAVYSVTGGGAYCNGGPGLLIGLSNSEPGVNYQLYRDATTAGSALAGTGAALSFGNQTVAGTYTVVATSATTSCTQNMTGSATVTINPLPTAFNVTGGGGYCSGGTGVSVGLSGS
ncbi:MAG TPA: hypothetical protein VK155_08810, partial [Bacteroidales bacterium]|nr:hypothetical protein [Bacteroidales bacterium]